MARKILMFVFVGLLSVSSASALTILQLNLEQLTALSERVFAGRCISVRQDRDKAGRPVQYVTYQVEEMLKGEKADKITYKQLGFAPEEDSKMTGQNVVVQGVFRDLPRYVVGEEDVIFLSADGPLGLTSPVGFFQGKFLIQSNGQSKGQSNPSEGGTGVVSKSVVNGMGNHGLFMGLKKSPRLKTLKLPSSEKALLGTDGGALPYDEFTSLVRKLAAP